MKFTKLVKSGIKKSAASEPIRIYLTNLGKYNEGELVGEWVDLPVDDNFEAVLKRIGINDQYEEWFITDYEAPFKIDEYENIFELNEKVQAIEDFDDLEQEIFTEYLDAGYDWEESAQKVKDNDYYYIEADSDEDLAYEYIAQTTGKIEDLGIETLERYFDYEKYGRDLAYDFHKISKGYVQLN